MADAPAFRILEDQLTRALGWTVEGNPSPTARFQELDPAYLDPHDTVKDNRGHVIYEPSQEEYVYKERYGISSKDCYLELTQQIEAKNLLANPPRSFNLIFGYHTLTFTGGDQHKASLTQEVVTHDVVTGGEGYTSEYLEDGRKITIKKDEYDTQRIVRDHQGRLIEKETDWTAESGYRDEKILRFYPPQGSYFINIKLEGTVQDLNSGAFETQHSYIELSSEGTLEFEGQPVLVEGKPVKTLSLSKDEVGKMYVWIQAEPPESYNGIVTNEGITQFKKHKLVGISLRLRDNKVKSLSCKTRDECFKLASSYDPLIVPEPKMKLAQFPVDQLSPNFIHLVFALWNVSSQLSQQTPTEPQNLFFEKLK